MRSRWRWPREWDDRANTLFVGALPILAVLAYAIVRTLQRDGLELAPGSISAQVRDLLWFGLACSIGSYAIIEIAVRIARTRGRFQRWQTRRWMEEKAGDALELGPNKTASKNPSGRSSVAWEALAELLSLWRIGYDESLRIFDLPTEQLAAQISSAVDVADTRREAYRPLIGCITGRSADFFAQDAQSDGGGSEQDGLRMAQDLRLGVDQLQIALSERWRRTVQGAAVWIAGLVGIALAHATHATPNAEPRHVFAALLIGGPGAWLVHDFTALVSRARH